MNPLATGFALILIGGIALLRWRHEKWLESELEASRLQALRMSLERESEAKANELKDTKMAEREIEFRKRVSELEGVCLKEKMMTLETEFELKAKEAQILALTSRKDEVEREVLVLTGRNEELERWMKEKQVELAERSEDIEELKTNIMAMEADMAYQIGCKDVLVLALTKANQELDRQALGLDTRNKELNHAMAEREVGFKEMASKLEEEILELKDKLSECHARLRLGGPDPWSFLKFGQTKLPLRDQPDDEEQAGRTRATFAYAPRDYSGEPWHQLYDAPTRATYAYSPPDHTPSPPSPQKMRRHQLYDAPLPDRPRAI